MNYAKCLVIGLMFFALACAQTQPPQAAPDQPAETPAAVEPAPAPEATATVEPAPAPEAAQPAADAPKSDMLQYWEKVIAAVPFTAEQQAQLDTLLGEIQQAEIAWEAQYGQDYRRLQKEFDEARTEGDAERMVAVRTEMGPMEDAKGDIYYQHDLNSTIKEMLTEEQQAPFIAARLYLFALKRYEAAELTDEQKQLVQEEADRVAPKLIAAGDPEREQGLADGMAQHVYDNLLTDEQRAAVEGDRIFSTLTKQFYGGLNLSTAQTEQIREMCVEAGKAVVAAEKPQQKYMIIMETQQRAFAEILTEDQQADFEAIKLYGATLRRFREAKMKYDQRAVVKDLCKQAGYRIIAVEDPKAKSAVGNEMLETVYNDVLTEEQKIAHQTGFLNNLVRSQFRRVGLTAEQRTRIEEMTSETAKEMVAVEQPAQMEIVRIFMDSVTEDVLTPQQRNLLPKPTTQPAATTAPAQAHPAAEPAAEAATDEAAPTEMPDESQEGDADMMEEQAADEPMAE